MIKALIITYYFPPAGGSGVQRWMFFSRYLKDYGIEPVVITVNSEKASYRFIDYSLEKNISNVRVFRTDTREILSVYSKVRGGDRRSNIPQGFAGESNPSILQKISRFIRGNFFIPDARIGWNNYAYKKASQLINEENFNVVITTGPPHSTHLVGKKLKEKFAIKWISDFRDPWSELYYNKALYRLKPAKKIDTRIELSVLNDADIITTIGPGMQKLLQNKLPEKFRSKVHYVYNGYDGDIFDHLKKHPSDKFNICHLGILSENQPIDSFLEGLSLCMKRNPQMQSYLKIKFIGNVSPSIIRKTEERVGSEHLEIIDYKPHAEAAQFMKDADLLLNSFAITEDSSLLVSGKLMEYIATGNPVIGLGHPEGDAAALMHGNEHMRVFKRTDIQGIALFVEKIYLHWLKKDISYSTDDIYKNYSRYSTTGELAKIIRSLV